MLGHFGNNYSLLATFMHQRTAKLDASVIETDLKLWLHVNSSLQKSMKFKISAPFQMIHSRVFFKCTILKKKERKMIGK